MIQNSQQPTNRTAPAGQPSSKDAAFSANLSYRDGRERLLIKCDNPVYAYEITELLSSHGIASRQHDEGQDPCVGAYGAVTGIAIFVLEKDYLKAADAIRPVIQQKNESCPSCPECGSHEVGRIIRRHHYGTIATWLCLAFILIPAVYFAWPTELGLRSVLTDRIALMAVVLGIVILFTLGNINKEFECRECGHKFNK